MLERRHHLYRSAECSERTTHAAQILRLVTDPEVRILGAARNTVRGDGLAARQQLLNPCGSKLRE